ncbi:MAG: hypothetical protein PWQ37_1581 [Candidatus Petromonas sp.]|nr:hypothetical protein [Candidatus Petromonas sp.]
MSNKKRRRRRRRLFLIAVFILIFGGMKFVQLIKPMLGFGSVRLKEVNTIKYLDKNDGKREITIEALNENVIKFEKDTLSLFDLKGKKLWEKKIDISKAIIKGNHEKVIVADSQTGKIFYLDYKGNETGHFLVDEPIYDIKINKDGYILIILKNKDSIYVLDSDGNKVSNINIPKGEIIDGDLSDDSSVIALSLLQIEENKFYSNILFYSLEGSILAGRKYDNDIIYRLFFVGNKEILCLKDDKIFKLTSEDKVLWEKKLEGVLHRGDLSEDGKLALNLVKKENIIIDTKNRSIVTQIDFRGKVLWETPIVGDIEGIDTYGDKVVAYTKRTLYFIDDKGNIILEKKINKDIRELYWISDDSLAIIYTDKVEIAQITT